LSGGVGFAQLLHEVGAVVSVAQIAGDLGAVEGLAGSAA
jgi:hypothetical protein